GDRDLRVRLPSCPRKREQPAELNLRLYLGLAGLPEPELPTGQRVLPRVYLGTPRSARKLLYVTGGGPGHGGGVHRPIALGPRTGPRTNLAVERNRWWGGWGSNPGPADYESAPAVPCVSMNVYRRRLQSSVDG